MKGTLLVPVVAALGACSTLEVHPLVYHKKKVAVAAYFGEKDPMLEGMGLVGSIKGSSELWGEKVIVGTFDEVSARLQRAMGAEFVPVEKVVAAPSYGQAKTVMAAGQHTAHKGMRPLTTLTSNHPALAKIASEVGADAVIVFLNQWTIEAREHPPKARDAYEIYIIGADGTKLWEQTDTIESAPADSTMAQVGAGLIGSITEETALTVLRDVTFRAVDKFCMYWGQNKPK